MDYNSKLHQNGGFAMPKKASSLPENYKFKKYKSK